MPMEPMEPMDRLEIEVEVQSTDAVKGLNSLKRTLEKLQEVSGKLDGIDATAAGRIRDLADALDRLSAAGSGTGLSKTVSLLRRLGRLDFSNLESATSSIKTVAATANPNVITPSTEAAGLPPDRYVESTEVPVEETNEKLGETVQKLRSIRDLFHSIGEDASTLGKIVGHITSRFRGFFKSLKRIAFYRLIRTVISTITNGIKEGVNAVYQYSKALDGKFASAMDRAATSLNYLKSALGTAFAPLIEVLVPLLEKLTDRLVDSVINPLSEALSALAGSKTWTKAIKVESEYAEAADAAAEANKRLKGSFLGIDELNVLKGSGSGTGAFSFMEVPIDEAKAGKTLNVLRGILTAIVAIKGVRAYLDLSKFAAALEAIGVAGAGILGPLALVLAALVTIGIWGDKISDGLDSLRVKIDEWCGGVIDSVSGFFDDLSAKVEGWSPTLSPSLQNLKKDVIGVVDYFRRQFGWLIYLTQDFTSTLHDLVTGNFTGMWDDISQGFEDFMTGIANLGIDLINLVIGLVERMINVSIINQINRLISIGQFFGAKWEKLDPVDFGRIGKIEYTTPPDSIKRTTVTASGQIGEISGKTAAPVSASAGSDEEVISAIMAAAEQITRAVQSKDTSVYLDGDKVGGLITSAQNRANRMYGAVLQNA